jgi:TonB family protein
MLSRFPLVLPLLLSLLLHALVIGIGEGVSRFSGKEDGSSPATVEYGGGERLAEDPEGEEENDDVPGHPGDSISLETPDPSYRPYFNKLRRKIGEHWQEPRGSSGTPKTGSLTVEFSLGRAGDLTSVEVAESSGEKDLDFASVEAVKKAAPFSPFPESISSKKLVIRALFVYD